MSLRKGWSRRRDLIQEGQARGKNGGGVALYIKKMHISFEVQREIQDQLIKSLKVKIKGGKEFHDRSELYTDTCSGGEDG